MKFISTKTSLSELVGMFLFGMYLVLLLGINTNGQVIQSDLAYLGSMYNNGEQNLAKVIKTKPDRPGKPGESDPTSDTYDRKYDFNDDGIVDAQDVAIFGKMINVSLDGEIVYSKSLSQYDLKKDKTLDEQDWFALAEFFTSSEELLSIFLDEDTNGTLDGIDVQNTANNLQWMIENNLYGVGLDYNYDNVLDLNDWKAYMGYLQTIDEALVYEISMFEGLNIVRNVSAIIHNGMYSTVYTLRGDFNADGVNDKDDWSIFLHYVKYTLGDEELIYDIFDDGTFNQRDVALIGDQIYYSLTFYWVRCDFNADGVTNYVDWAMALDYTKNIARHEEFIYDYDGNGINNDADVDLISDALRRNISRGEYYPRVDFNTDGVIDQQDWLTFTDFAGITDSLGTLMVNESTLNPPASVIKVDETVVTDDITVFAFDFTARGSDFLIYELPLTWSIGASAFENVVSGLKLVVGDDVYDMYSTEYISLNSNLIATTLFDLGQGINVPQGEVVTVKVVVDLKPITGNYAQNETLQVGLVSDGIVATDEYDLWLVNRIGVAESATHQLMSEGIFAQIVSTDVGTNYVSGYEGDIGEFEIQLDITAFENDFYLFSTSSFAFGYILENESQTRVSSTSLSAVVSSTADEGSNGNYVVYDGQTETFTLQVRYAPSIDDMYRMQLNAITYGTSEGMPYGLTHYVTPRPDFATDYVFLEGNGLDAATPYSGAYPTPSRDNDDASSDFDFSEGVLY